MFIISEISPQFHGDLALAEQMILQSKIGGASAVKVQLYSETAFGNERAYLSMTFEELKHLKSFADGLNMKFFATAFDFERLDWCLDLKLPYLKVAARMHRENPSLVEAIYSKNIPVFVSIPSDLPTDLILKSNNATYLYCILKYPTRLDEFSIPNFNTSIFDGISDHSIGIAGSLYAAAHGAKFLEKHFTLHIGDQRSTEQAHLGGMDLADLQNIKNYSLQFQQINPI